MFTQLILFTLLVTVIYANLVGWRDCGSPFAELRFIRISNCLETPCFFVRGQSYLVEVDAVARANSNTLPFVTTASILGLNVTLVSGNACDYLSVGTCPAINGFPFTFSMLYEVPTTLPPVFESPSDKCFGQISYKT